MELTASPTRKKRRNLTPAQRAAVVAFLLSVSVELVPPVGAIRDCARANERSDDQIARMWRRAVEDIKNGRPINYESGRKGRSGRKSRMTEEFRHDLNHAIELIPLEERTDIRTLANALGIAKSTLHNYFRAGVFRCHTAHVKPLLTDDQRVARVQFALRFVCPSPRGDLHFDAMLEYVHLDEK